MLPIERFDWHASRCLADKKQLPVALARCGHPSLCSRGALCRAGNRTGSQRKATDASLPSDAFHQKFIAWQIKMTELIKTQQHALKIICHWHNDHLCLLAALRSGHCCESCQMEAFNWDLLYYLSITIFSLRRKKHNKSGQSWVKRFDADMFPIQTKSLLYEVNLIETKSGSAEQQALILQAHEFPAQSRPDYSST